MIEFRLTLVDEKYRTFRLLTFLIYVINLSIFLILSLNASDTTGKSLFAAGMLINAIGFVSGFIRKNKEESFFALAGKYLIVSSAIWLYSRHWLPALSSLGMGIFSFRMAKGIVIICNKDGILRPYFPSRFIPWNNIVTIILKDDILTLEDQGNHVLQSRISKESAMALNEAEFNDFCRQQMAAAGRS